MDLNDIIRPGTEIKFKKQFSNINGIVKAVWIGGDGVQYEVTYMHNGVINNQYIPKEMFEVVDHQPAPAGFRLNEPKSPC